MLRTFQSDQVFNVLSNELEKDWANSFRLTWLYDFFILFLQFFLNGLCSFIPPLNSQSCEHHIQCVQDFDHALCPVPRLAHYVRTRTVTALNLTNQGAESRAVPRVQEAGARGPKTETHTHTHM